MSVNQFTLGNGLRVVHEYVPDSAMVVLDVMYDVGGRDDPSHLTGMAHLMEHLMFGGSRHVADFDEQLELAGGTSNAWTSDDYTNYWEIAPAVNAETLFYVESDRMLAPGLSEQSLEVQRSVVLEEFKQTHLNRPYGDLSHHVRRLLYGTAHPYGVPVIGFEPQHIENITAADVQQFFATHYTPQRAVVAVAGNITLERTKQLAEKWFADIPARHAEPRKQVSDIEVAAPVTERIKAPVPNTAIVMAYPMPGLKSPHYIGADLLTDILSADRSGRIYRHLVAGTDLFVQADASIAGLTEQGYLLVTAILRENTPEAIEQSIAALNHEMLQTTITPPTETEMLKAHTNHQANQLMSQVTLLGKVNTLATDVIQGIDAEERMQQYLSTTAADILATARAIITPTPAVTLIYGPEV